MLIRVIYSGISIQELFQRFDNQFTVEAGVKNGLWETVLSLDHVLLGDEKEKLAFKMLPLDTLFTLRLGDRKLRLQSAVPVPKEGADTIKVDNSPAPAPAPQPLVDMSAPEPPKKRRGRPPKEKKEDPSPILKGPSRKTQATDSPGRDTPIPSIETTTNESPDNAHTKHRGSPRPVVAKMKAAVNSAVNAVQGGFRNLRRSRSKTVEKNPQLDSALEDASGTRRSTRIRSHTPINYSLRRSRTPSFSGQDGGVRHASNGSGNLQPVQEDAQANSNATKDGEVSENQNQDVVDTPPITHVPAPRSPSPETPVGESAAPPQHTPAKKTRGRPRIESPEDEFGETSIMSRKDTLHNKDRLAGLSGVYKDPSESTKRRNQTEFAASAVLVFKSDKLKSPNWLEENRGCWEEPIAEAIAAAIIEKEDTTEAPRRRRQDTRKKDTSVKLSDDNLELATAEKDVKATKKRKRDEESEKLGETTEREGELEPSAKRQKTPVNNKRKAVDSVDGSPPNQPQAKRQRSNPPDETEALAEPLGEQHKEPAEALAELLGEQHKEPSAVLAGPPAEGEMPVSAVGATPGTRPVKPKPKRKMSITSSAQSHGEPAPKKQRKNAESTPLTLDPNGTSVATGTQQYPIPASHPPFPQNASHQIPYQPQPKSFYPREVSNLDQVFNTQPPVVPSFFGSSNTYSFGDPAVGSHAISSYDAPPSGVGMPTMQSAVPRYLQGSQHAPSYQSPYAPKQQQHQPPTYRSPYAPVTPTLAHPLDLPQPSNIQPSEAVSPPSTPAVFPASQSLPTTNFENYDHQSAIFASNPTSKPKATGPKNPTPAKRKRGRPKKVSVDLSSTALDPETEAKSRELVIPLPTPSNKSPSPSTPPSLSNRKTSISSSNEAEHVIPKPPKFISKAQRAAQEKIEVEAAFVTASAIDIPEGVIRLAARYEQVVGNLLLSKDKQVLEFFGISQHPPELPMFAMDISKMSQNPITSIKGSYPMEIRIMSGQRGRPKAHCFQFSTTSEAYEAASQMRSKLVTAKITLQIQTGGEYDGPREAEYGILKPWKCEKCGARFKNDLGLKYHVTKSQTECNPNFDASQLMPRKKYVPRKSKKVSKRASRITDSAPRSSTQQKLENLDMAKVEGREGPDEETDDSSSGDSNDSIFEWAQTVATDGIQAKKYDAKNTQDAAQSDSEDGVISDVVSYAPAAQIPSGPRKDKYRRMRFEGEFLNEIAKEYNHRLADSVLLTSFSRAVFVPARDEKLFQKRVLALVRGNGGMFPGDKSLWYAFVAAWLKHPDKSGDLPEFKYMARAVDQLINAKRILHFEISCKPIHASTRGATRTFIVASDVVSNTSRIERLKNHIRKSFPGHYVPSRYAPPEPWVSKMKTLLTNQGNWGPINAEIFDYEDDEEDLQNEPVPEDEIELDESSDEEDEPHEASRRIRRSQVSLGDDLSSENSDYLAPRRRRAIYYGPGTQRNRANEPGIPLTPEEKERRARLAYLRLHAWAPALASMPNTTTGAWDQVKAIKKSLPLTEEERERRAQQALSRTHGWAPAREFLPNPKTGAWNQKPRTRRFERKPRMPEPITFLQAPTGAWSQRAFGHGVEPVFSRPARRTGNRQQTYLQRLDNGFRPVVVPKKGKPLRDIPSNGSLQRPRDSPLYDSGSDLRQSIELQQSTELDHKPRKRSRKGKAVEDPHDENTVRVSKATGRPVRKYVRKQTTLSGVDSVNYSLESSTEPENVRRSDRMPKLGVRSLNEIDLLDKFIESEPKIVERKARANPGLETLPESFWSTNSEKGGSTPGYDNVQFSNPKIASYECDMVDGSWTCHNSQIHTPATFKLRWSEEDAFTVKTIPYYDIERDLEEAEVSEPDHTHQKRQQRESLLKSNQEASQDIFETARQQIALLGDFAQVLPDPKEAPKTFGVEISSHSVRTRTKNGIRTSTISAAFDTRLIFAVIVIRTLTGGLEGLIDWVILSKLFPDYSIRTLNQSWRQLSKKCGTQVDELVGDFQTKFLAAYQKGVFPAIDFDNLMNYDWDALIDWTLATLPAPLGSRSIALPSTRQELEAEYTLSEPRDNEPQNWRATYFSHVSRAPIYKRLGVACSIPPSLPIHKSHSTPSNGLEIAKSWVRAVALTPESEWSLCSSLARDKLSSLGTPVVEKAVAELKETKIIHHRMRGRASPGRSYEVMDAVIAPLRKTISAAQFVQAVRFKRFLDERFANGQERVRLQYMTDGGATMCINHLQAGRRVRLDGINVPMERFGMCKDDGYETRSIPKERLRFDIDMLPTPSYLLTDSLPILDVPPPGPRENGELPIWLDIGGQVIWDLWRRIVVAVAQTVALRSGVTLEGLVKAFSPTFGKWEMRCLVEWGVQVGMFERVHPRIEGWTVGEWWWVIVGNICEGGDEVVV